MRLEIRQLVEKGVRSLASANNLFQDGDYDFAVSRAYYAMFYLAEAVLLLRGLTFSKHSAVISAFGRELVKPGHLPETLHKALREGFTERAVGDYEVKEPYPRERAEGVLAGARDFVTAVRVFVERGSII
ncbi:MAG: HEPN domain-containing protein [Planctomycetes bacterium]|nr:HEPN domain-containing protein [Planctomycetota bacterium]